MFPKHFSDTVRSGFEHPDITSVVLRISLCRHLVGYLVYGTVKISLHLIDIWWFLGLDPVLQLPMKQTSLLDPNHTWVGKMEWEEVLASEYYGNGIMITIKLWMKIPSDKILGNEG